MTGAMRGPAGDREAMPPVKGILMNTSLATPEGPGSVSGAPGLTALTAFLAPYRDAAAPTLNAQAAGA